MTTDRIKAISQAARDISRVALAGHSQPPSALGHADRIAIRNFLELPEGSKVRDWDQCLLVKVGPDAWQVEPESGEGTLNEGAAYGFSAPIPTETLVLAYGPITLAELPLVESDLPELARRAAAAEYSRRFTLCQTTRGQAYTDAIAAAVLSALMPYLDAEAPK